MIKKAQPVIQITFLLLFFILISIGKIQIWMGLLVMGITLAMWYGRIYCGWICPINTAMSFILWLKIKLHIESIEIPSFLLKPWSKFIVLAAFIATFLISIVSGVKLPVLPVLFLLGVLITFFYPPELWHRNLCPFGTILNYPAKFARHSMRIEPDKCNHCGLCYQICPAKSVEKLDESYQIAKNECLVCMKCSRKCRKNATTYQ